MTRRVLLIAAAGGAAGLLAWRYLQSGAQPVAQAVSDAGGALASAATSASDFIGGVVKSLTGWNVDKVPAQYASAIAQAEAVNGLPKNLLARLLWQESRYREDIISGVVRSSAGAVGIAQFMPATAADFGIDPLDPFASIAASGRYLGQLYRHFGDWAEAVAAYNWGQGNVDRKGLARAPAETRQYYTSILADIGMGGAIA